MAAGSATRIAFALCSTGAQLVGSVVIQRRSLRFRRRRPRYPLAVLLKSYNVKAYRAYLDSATEELGDATLDDVVALLLSARDSETTRPFTIGFYRSERDFVEISYVGKDQWLVWSDCIALPFWRRLFFNRHIRKVVHGVERASDAVKTYMEQPRECFEHTYK